MTSLLCKLAKFYPFSKGRGRLALARVNQASVNTLALAKLSCGADIYVYTRDYIGQMVLLFGDLDPTVSAFILKNISKGDLIIDVGANLGIISLPAASKVGLNGKVVAIEPNPACAKALSLSKKKNKFQNLEILCCALSSCAGKAHLDVPFNSYGQATISAEATPSSHECEVMTLDNISEDIRGGRVRVLKIDVEGHEHQVLLGGECLLRSGRVDIIVFESHQRECSFGSRLEVVHLTSCGYIIYELRKGALLSAKLRRTDHSYIPFGSEFVALRKGVCLDVRTGIVRECPDD